MAARPQLHITALAVGGAGGHHLERDVTQRVRDGRLDAVEDGGSLGRTSGWWRASTPRSVGCSTRSAPPAQDATTLVWFASDNGGERYSNEGPLRGRKFELTEGGIRVPMIVRWPGRIEAGRVSHEPVITQDWTTTFLELAGRARAPRTPRRQEPGRSPRDRRTGRRRRYCSGGATSAHAFRRGRWKYLRTTDDSLTVDALYDLQADVGEASDHSATQPDLLAELRDHDGRRSTAVYAIPRTVSCAATSHCGAGGDRTRDLGVMSPLL